MKKFVYFFTVLSLMLAVGCGDDTTEVIEPAPTGPQAPYTLSADRLEIAVGESVTFSVTSSDGVDISDKCTYCSNASCYTSRTVRLDAAGVYPFEGHYMNGDPAYPAGVPTDNILEIVVTDGGDEPVGGYLLSASKTTVRAGKGVTLAMHSPEGDDVTKQSVFFKDGEQLDVARFVTDAEPREYVVTALYMGDENYPEGIEASNTVTIKAINDDYVYTLVPSHASRFVNESVSFEVWNNYEEELTGEFVILDPDGKRVESPYYYKFTSAGDYTFTATRGEDVTEPVTVTVTVPSEIDKSRFYRRSVMGDLTATWCMQCPSMIGMLDYLEENLIDDRLVVVGVHAGGGTIPSELGDMGEIFMSLLTGFEKVIWNQIPAYTIDYNYKYTSNAWSPKPESYDTGAPLIERMISGSQSEDKGVPGIAASSSLDGRTLDLDIRVTARDADDYYIGVALIEDKIKAYQAGANNITHRHVGQGMITDRTQVAVPVGRLAAGEEKVLEYTYEIPEKLHGLYVNLDNCTVAIWVCRKNSDATVAPLGYTCANAMSLGLDESLDYQYEYKR